MEQEIKKLSNRAIQNVYVTYKSKNEVDKALRLLKTVKTLHLSTHKFLGYFSHKGAKGVTQAKFDTICETVGISKNTYHRTVKPDLESFPEPLIIQIPTRKLGKNGIENKGSSYKVLQPLSKIEKWVPEKQNEFLQEQFQLIEKIKKEMDTKTAEIINSYKQYL